MGEGKKPTPSFEEAKSFQGRDIRGKHFLSLNLGEEGKGGYRESIISPNRRILAARPELHKG